MSAIEGLGRWPRSNGPEMFWFDHEWPALEPGRPLGSVTSVAEDVDGTLYVLGRGRVMDPLIALAPDGRYLRSVRTWDDGLFEYPHGLRIDTDHTLWATDLRRHQVFRLNRDGDVLLELGVRGEAGGGDRLLDGPTDIAFSPGGEVLVGDGHGPYARIVRFDPGGRYVGALGRTDGRPGDRPGELNLPHSLAFGPDGRLYVCDRHNYRIQVFDADGRSVAMWTNVGEPHWIDIGADGEAWVVTSHTLLDLATAGEPPIRNLTYSAAESRLLRMDLATGTILGALEAPPQTGGHAITRTRSGGLVISSLTRGISTWQPGMHPAFEGEWGNIRERPPEVVARYIPGAGATTGQTSEGADG